MFAVLYTYRTHYHGQLARGERLFDNEDEARTYARRLESTPGHTDVTVWRGLHKIA